MSNTAPQGSIQDLEREKFIQPGGVGTQVYVATIPVPSPLSLPTAPLAGQVSVTTSAAAFPSVVLTVGALITNTSTSATLYLGPSGVTTTTGMPVAPGATVSVALSNLNTLYAIGSSALTLGYLGS